MDKKKTTIVVLFIISAIFLSLSLYSAYRFTHPPRKNPKELPSDLNLSYQNLTFESGNKTLKGWFMPSSDKEANTTVLIVHGYGESKSSYLKVAKMLNSKYNIFAFDLRGHGESGGSTTTFGFKESKDIVEAVRAVKNITKGKIYGIGYSMGGSALAIAKNKSNSIDKIVIDSAFSDFNKAYLETAEDLPLLSYLREIIFPFLEGYIKTDPSHISPKRSIKSNKNVFIIHSKNDAVLNESNAYSLYNNAKKPKKIWIVEDARHRKIYKRYPEEYEKKVMSFFED